MKKWLIRIALAVVVLLVLVVIALRLFLDQAVKKGVETVGPQLTKVSIKLDSVGLSVLTGSGSIKGLEVGNPEGYKAPTAIKLGKASLSVSPGSLLSDKIVVKSIRIEAPEINIEGSPTKNNLTKILDNVTAAAGGGGSAKPATSESASSKKFQVDEFVLTGAKVNYTVPGIKVTVPIALPDIKLTGLGTGPEGITAGDLTAQIMSKVTGDLVPLLTQAASKLGKGAVDAASDTVSKATDKAAKSVTDIFKKK